MNCKTAPRTLRQMYRLFEYWADPDKHRNATRRYRQTEKGKAARRKYQLWYQTTKKGKAILKRAGARFTFKLKVEVLTHYGPDCRRCHFKDFRALSLDHINGNGCKHRKELGLNAGTTFYRWIKRNGFPKGYQTLCMNCQFIKKVENNESRH